MIRLVDVLYKLAFREKSVPWHYRSIPSNYWQKAVGEHYERPLKLLKEHDVVQSTESYSNFEGQNYSKTHRINPTLIDDKVEPITYMIKVHEGIDQSKDSSVVVMYTMRMLGSVKINARAAKQGVMSYVEQGKFKEKLQIDDDLQGNSFIDEADTSRLPYYNRDTFSGTTDLAKMEANKRGCSLIKDKSRYVMEAKESYFKRKAEHIIQSYSYNIAMLQHRKYYANRNLTNYRLDSNITSFPTILLPYITLNEEQLNSIDLSNSQFTILANLIVRGDFDQYFDNFFQEDYKRILKELCQEGYLIRHTATHYKLRQHKEEVQTAVTLMSAKSPIGTCLASMGNAHMPYDLLRFLELAKSGKIYEFIEVELALPNRSAAKSLAFEIFFSSRKYHGEAKRQLKKIFPTLIRLIDAYKKANGDEQFAILLQRRESAIFIDRIMPHLIEKGYKVLSKHDSILCLASELLRVEAEVRTILDEELGQYELKLTDAYGNPINIPN